MRGDWFNANKVTIGGLLTVVGGVLATASETNPRMQIWAQIFLAAGPFLAGGGMMRPDSYYKTYDGEERRKDAGSVRIGDVALGAGLLLFASVLVTLVVLIVNPQQPPEDRHYSGTLQPGPTPTPEPFEPPDPEPVEDDPMLAQQPRLRVMNVCHCPTPYGPCSNVAMPVAIAMQFHREHWHDLIDMQCASERAEDWHLFRILLRPDGVHYFTRNRLAMADRAARRERLAP